MTLEISRLPEVQTSVIHTLNHSQENKLTFKKVCEVTVQFVAVAALVTLAQIRIDIRDNGGVKSLPLDVLVGVGASLGCIFLRYSYFKDRGIENYISNREEARKIHVETTMTKSRSTQELVEEFIKNDSKVSEKYRKENS